MLEIIFATDYVCPYCIVGKAALKAAAKELNLEIRFITAPKELTVEPAPRVDTYHDLVRREHYQILVEPARQLGLDIKLPPAVVPRPYTRLAFEGHCYAEDMGRAEAYDDAVYRAYFIEEKDIEQVEILGDIAASVGLDRLEYLKCLKDGIYTQRHRIADAYTKENLKVKGIPTLFINGKKYEFEDYTIDDAKRILTGASTEATSEFHGCGEDGCW